MTSNAAAMSDAEFDMVVEKAEAYYDSEDADNFYFNIWGGEDIHIGFYDETDDIATASRRTVSEMVKVAGPLNKDSVVLDIGAGYGGAARQLAASVGCKVTCLNLSQTQNDKNKELTKKGGLDHLITVEHGNFENIPGADSRYDVVWSQDSILHSARRRRVLEEVYRVLKPGGIFIFTDPMQADDCPDGVLQDVYDRIHLKNLGSFAFYRKTAKALNFETVAIRDHSKQLLNHYTRVREELTANYDRLVRVSSKDYLDTMIEGLGHWVAAAKRGHLAWGILCFKKPK